MQLGFAINNEKKNNKVIKTVKGIVSVKQAKGNFSKYSTDIKSIAIQWLAIILIKGCNI